MKSLILICTREFQLWSNLQWDKGVHQPGGQLSPPASGSRRISRLIQSSWRGWTQSVATARAVGPFCSRYPPAALGRCGR
jgi:hypothetical protein